jgi:hypothetical protein
MWNMDSQEEVESPTARVPRHVRADAAIQTTPAVPGADVCESIPYLPSYRAARALGRHLQLDLEQVEWVHAKHGYDARADPGCRMVLSQG